MSVPTQRHLEASSDEAPEEPRHRMRGYPESEVHHGDPWHPAGSPSFQAAFQRTLTFLTAWGLKQREVEAAAARADVGVRLAASFRETERLTHELLGGNVPAASDDTGELRIVRHD